MKSFSALLVFWLTSECSLVASQPNNTVSLVGILDTDNFDWAELIFDATISFLNDDDIFNNNMFISHAVENSACDAYQALEAYWKRRPMHGVVGARCSGASTPLAWIGSLEGVPQISMSSTSAKLSDKSEFPFFSRTVSPDDERGQVGALVATLRLFGWDRVNILITDTTYAKDMATAFQAAWRGESFLLGTVKLDPTSNLIDVDSALKILQDAPTDDPTVNSRVVLLLAHDQHAFPILELATPILQPDTIFVGPQAWVGRPPPAAGLPEHPGYIGVTPFRNRGPAYQDYLAHLQDYQRSHGITPVWEELPDYAAEYTVDAIVAMAMALARTPPSQRTDGALVTANLRSLDFEGVSGRVQFTPDTGDRLDPQFTIFNLQRTGPSSYDWVAVGSTGTGIDSARFEPGGIRNVCFAQVGCGLSEAPLATYPIPSEPVETWVVVVIPLLCILFFTTFLCYRRRKKAKSRQQKEVIAAKQAEIEAKNAELDEFRKSVVGMCTAKDQYIPVASTFVSDDETLVVETPSPQWCWRETDGYMDRHDDDQIVGDPVDCWVKYGEEAGDLLEAAFQEQGGKGDCVPLQGYTVSFDTMTQTKDATGFQRDVLRRELDGEVPEQAFDLSKVHTGKNRPKELSEEPQMVLVEGDIVQISKQRNDGWAYGTKLFLADEPLARRLVEVALGGSENVKDDSTVLVDTGWFPMDVTRTPNTDDLATLQKSVGDTSDLAAPSEWDPVADPSVVQNHVLSKGSSEYQKVANAFLSSSRRNTQIVRIERIQNLAMWQSYVVKRKTICDRDQSLAYGARSIQQAMARFERRWLWHGTNVQAMDKITQQGFNRSFCGKNATVYGKGVYFARDSSYSSSETYAVADDQNQQYIMACRVVVGEYCIGRHDARTPDLRDAAKNILYDSTVGLLGNDTMVNPSIYVTYHDAQAYPEYLIVFRRN